MPEQGGLLQNLRELAALLAGRMKSDHARHVSLGDLINDRWETARRYGFGEGTSCYDNVLILGEVEVGKNTWIGPNVILDGSGGLEIGDNCSISAGVQIYSHHTVKWATSMGAEQPEYAPVKIGSGVYLGPQAVIQKGVTIGDRAVIGAMSLINRDIPDDAKALGVPAKIVKE